MSKPVSGRYVSFAERAQSALLSVRGLGVREIIHDVGFSKKRYRTSKGIALPDVVTYAHLGADFSRGEAVAAAYECVDRHGADPSNAPLFWNRGIGVFWMAAGNVG
ncbi:hypothetical protein [Pandoraea oxalativorans]|uniref:hypothetical protein n=1 Tax=Pandoraea oxalativorans TaxID=573737 RepID=UPI001FDEE4D5|nr:hypothetical protein [Pandoraea oxalativorans]